MFAESIIGYPETVRKKIPLRENLRTYPKPGRIQLSILSLIRYFNSKHKEFSYRNKINGKKHLMVDHGRKILIRFSIVLMFFNLLIYAQNKNIIVKNLSIPEGLSQSNIRCILKDRFGFIWLGTQDGLNRYDGYEFVVYKYNPADENSIGDNLVSCMIEDREGNLWLGTLNGITKFNPVKNLFTRFNTELKNGNTLKSSSVISLYEDKEGIIWAGTYLGGLSKYDKKGNKFITYYNIPGNENSLSNNSVTAISEDNNGNIWLGTFGGGLDKFNKASKTFSHFRTSGKTGYTLNSNYISALVANGQNLYIGTSNGLNVLNLLSNKIASFSHGMNSVKGLSSNKILSLFVAESNNLLIGTEDNGLDCFNMYNKTFSREIWNTINQNELLAKNITSAFSDNNGIIWLGTRTGGLYKVLISPKNFENFVHNPRDNNSITNSSVRCIFQDKLKNVWIGSDNGLTKINSKTKIFSRYFHETTNPNSLTNNTVWCMAEDMNGFIWIGTQDGLNKFDPSINSFKRFTYNPSVRNGIPFNVIRYIYIDKAGILWLGTFGYGLIKFDPSKNIFTTYSNSLDDPTSIGDNVIFQITDDRTGNLWVCTSRGLNKFDRRTEKFTRLVNDSNRDESIGANAIYSILEDSAGNFWLGTHGSGLIKIDCNGKKIRSYTEADGLPNNVVYGVVNDENGNLWMSTNKGISNFLVNKGEFKNYDINDGLPSNEFNSDAFLKSSSGKIYFGSINGLVSFHPDSIRENKKIPGVAITKFKIFEKQYGGKHYIPANEQINLSYQDNFFSIEFAALDFTEPSKNEFSYKLEGIDPDWVHAGNRHFASYTHLSPGNYIFTVRACNNDGYWNNGGVSLAIIISPPFWHTWWFRIITALTALSVIIFLIEKRIQGIKKLQTVQQRFSKLLIDSQEGERKRIASELHDSVGQDLIIIKNRAMFGIESPSPAIKDEQIREIINISTQTIKDVRAISYNLRPYQLGKLGLTNALDSLIKKAASATNINFITEIKNIDETLGEDNEIHFFRIIQECLNNAIKHSGSNEVKIHIEQKENMLNFEYQDNGVGFEKDSTMLDKEKSGMGLFDISERVKILGGNLYIDTAPGRGVLILIKIPLRTA